MNQDHLLKIIHGPYLKQFNVGSLSTDLHLTNIDKEAKILGWEAHAYDRMVCKH